MNKAPTTTKILAEAKKAGLIVRRVSGAHFVPFYKIEGVAGLFTKGALARRLGYAA